MFLISNYDFYFINNSPHWKLDSWVQQSSSELLWWLYRGTMHLSKTLPVVQGLHAEQLSDSYYYTTFNQQLFAYLQSASLLISAWWYVQCMNFHLLSYWELCFSNSFYSFGCSFRHLLHVWRRESNYFKLDLKQILKLEFDILIPENIKEIHELIKDLSRWIRSSMAH